MDVLDRCAGVPTRCDYATRTAARLDHVFSCPLRNKRADMEQDQDRDNLFFLGPAWRSWSDWVRGPRRGPSLTSARPIL